MRTAKGFTLVELLIAATMIAILFVGIAAHLRGGLTVWRRATDHGEAAQRMRVALDRLERDVVHAIVYDDRKERYGADGLLPLPGFGSGELRFFTQTVTRSGYPPSLRLVTYQCSPSSATPGLWRTSQAIAEARGNIAPTPEAMLPECAELSLRYAFQLSESSEAPSVMDWRPTWPDDPNEPLRLPRLVEVTIRSAAGRLARRIIAVPVGQFGTPVLPPAEEGAGGGGGA